MKAQDINRRNFIQAGFLAAAGLAAVESLPAEEPRVKLVRDRFIHSVYFWLKPGLSAPDLEKVVGGLQTLTRVIEEE